MVLKSTRLKMKKRPKKELKPVKSILTGGITALIGTALFLETARILRRI